MVPGWLRIVCVTASAGLVSAVCLAEDAGAPPSTPQVVYVSDFELDAAKVTPDSGPGQRARGMVGSLLPSGPLRQKQDPQARAHKIVELMAKSLTKDLKKAGVDARRITPDEPLPHAGWQVRGVFLSVAEGNRLRRAMVGMGAGQYQFQVAVSCDNLAQPDMPPLYENVEQGASRDKPGAVIRLNPYVIAAKVVLAGHDETEAIERSAQQIADALTQRLQGGVK